MPPFAETLSDPEPSALTGYLRAPHPDKAPWPALDIQARKARAAR